MITNWFGMPSHSCCYHDAITDFCNATGGDVSESIKNYGYARRYKGSEIAGYKKN